MGRNGDLAQLRPALSLRHVRFAATATGGSMTIMGRTAVVREPWPESRFWVELVPTSRESERLGSPHNRRSGR